MEGLALVVMDVDLLPLNYHRFDDFGKARPTWAQGHTWGRSIAPGSTDHEPGGGRIGHLRAAMPSLHHD
jgi:hypothetical protein